MHWTDLYGTDPIHSFLLDYYDELKKDAKKLPRIRNRVRNMPETKSVITTKAFDFHVHTVPNTIFKLAGLWPLPDDYGGTWRKFVVANSIDASRYTDVVVECACGAKFSRSYDSNTSVRDAHEHSDDCKPYHRLEARAALSRKREFGLLEGVYYGWKGEWIGRRLGLNPSSYSNTADRFGYTYTDLRKGYRLAAINTWDKAMDNGATKEELAEVYDISTRTMDRWRYSM